MVMCMKKFLMGLLLSLAVCTPAYAHSHIGINIQVPGMSIGYRNGYHGHNHFDLRVYPVYPVYPQPAYSPYPVYPTYQYYQQYVYRQVPVYCVDYYGYRYVCGYRNVLVPTY